MKYFMGIDVGTNSSKGVLTDENFSVIASEQIMHDVENPKPGYFEHDAETIWWGETCTISKALLLKSGIAPEAVAGIGISALGCDVLPVDENIRPLRKAILYGIDSRATEEMAYMDTYCAEHGIDTGRGPYNSADCMPKILWIKHREPEVYEKTAKFLTASSFITARLCGAFVMDNYLSGCYAPCFQADGTLNAAYEKDLLGRDDYLAVPHFCTDIVGAVTPEASRLTGLPAGTPVICGTDDSAAEAISSGVVSNGDLLVQLGSTCYMIYCSDTDEKGLSAAYSSNYVIPGKYCIDGATNACGNLTKWLRNEMYRDLLAEEKETGIDAYQRMAEEAKDIPAGSDGVIVLPYFAGEQTPVFDSQAKGIIMGLLLHHKRGHIYRAALESTAYSITQFIRILQEKDLRVRHLICTGGGSKNPLWLQIIADVTGHAVECPSINIGASYGDALIAGIGNGYIPDFDTLKGILQFQEVILPREEYRELYDRRLAEYEQLYQNNKDYMKKLY